MFWIYTRIKSHCVYTSVYVLCFLFENSLAATRSKFCVCGTEVAEHLGKLKALGKTGHKSSQDGFVQ